MACNWDTKPTYKHVKTFTFGDASCKCRALVTQSLWYLIRDLHCQCVVAGNRRTLSRLNGAISFCSTSENLRLTLSKQPFLSFLCLLAIGLLLGLPIVRIQGEHCDLVTEDSTLVT